MAYRVEVGPKARTQLDELDATVGAAVERKIIWLAENADVIVHRRLVGMPDDLADQCKLRVGTGAFSIGSITVRKLCAFIESSPDPKCIEISEVVCSCAPQFFN